MGGAYAVSQCGNVHFLLLLLWTGYAAIVTDTRCAPVAQSGEVGQQWFEATVGVVVVVVVVLTGSAACSIESVTGRVA